MNLSDIAAMAGVPRAAVVAVALPQAGASELARGLYDGMATLAERFGVDLIGGDTNAWDGPLVISVTLLGEATARGAVCRTGRRPGDAILVTGPLGGSLHAGRHLRPEPRVAEALALACSRAVARHDRYLRRPLVRPVAHPDESGGLGRHSRRTAIPIHPDAREMSRVDGVPPLEHALCDGEDFELCVVVSAARCGATAGRASARDCTLFRVGEITEAPGLDASLIRRRDSGRSLRAGSTISSRNA